jgi:phage FluMu gp28-like protein
MRGPFFAGMDVGWHLDKTVVTLLQRSQTGHYRMVAMMTMVRIDTFEQRKEIEWLFVQVPDISRITVDFSGIGTGLVDEMVRGSVGYRCMGINFSSYVPIPAGMAADGMREERVPVTTVMAHGLANALKHRALEIPPFLELQNSLHLPEKVSNAEGTRVRIAATRSKDESGNYEHADYFWSLALAVYGAANGSLGAFTAEDVAGVECSELLFSGKGISFPETSNVLRFA